eukprot:GHVQ01043639.1.p1 GENE.GHVQ01043639.1~~GHVQ01043639.1.p1  ORF type:complete len:277 (+),score=26.84 GHVQ01043639.1:118-948(+)
MKVNMKCSYYKYVSQNDRSLAILIVESVVFIVLFMWVAAFMAGWSILPYLKVVFPHSYHGPSIQIGDGGGPGMRFSACHATDVEQPAEGTPLHVCLGYRTCAEAKPEWHDFSWIHHLPIARMTFDRLMETVMARLAQQFGGDSETVTQHLMSIPLVCDRIVLSDAELTEARHLMESSMAGNIPVSGSAHDGMPSVARSFPVANDGMPSISRSFPGSERANHFVGGFSGSLPVSGRAHDGVDSLSGHYPVPERANDVVDTGLQTEVEMTSSAPKLNA